MTVYSVDKLIAEARRLSAEYRKATGRPLGGVSGEIAEHDAARLLELDLCDPKPGGYDAIGRGRRAGKRIQIKGRAIFDEGKAGQRIGQMKTDQEWDSVMLVLMDENFEPYEIYEAEREDILQAIAGSDASRRNKRGAMSVAKFKIISQLVWTREAGAEEGGGWDSQ
ncbi:MAG: hypothetical protein HYX62_07825 [Gammaproteobacteria bacterium]|nr:hypothetical protein [Gammaproteobacteria bacterium]